MVGEIDQGSTQDFCAREGKWDAQAIFFAISARNVAITKKGFVQDGGERMSAIPA